MKGTWRAGIVGGLLCFSAALATWLLVIKSPYVANLDYRALNGFIDLEDQLGAFAERVTPQITPNRFAVFCSIVVLVAVFRRQFPVAIVAGVILLGSNLTTQYLKATLLDPRANGAVDRIGAWPSGHTTAVMSLVLTAVLVSPARFRPLVGSAGGLVAVTYVYCILIRGHHLPSDIIGGLFMATGFTFIGMAALAIWDSVRSSKAVESPLKVIPTVVPPLVAGVLLLFVVIALLAAQYGSISSLIPNEGALTGGAVLIGLLGLTLSFSVSLFYRRA